MVPNEADAPARRAILVLLLFNDDVRKVHENSWGKGGERMRKHQQTNRAQTRKRSVAHSVCRCVTGTAFLTPVKERQGLDNVLFFLNYALVVTSRRTFSPLMVVMPTSCTLPGVADMDGPRTVLTVPDVAMEASL